MCLVLCTKKKNRDRWKFQKNQKSNRLYCHKQEKVKFTPIREVLAVTFYIDLVRGIRIMLARAKQTREATERAYNIIKLKY